MSSKQLEFYNKTNENVFVAIYLVQYNSSQKDYNFFIIDQEKLLAKKSKETFYANPKLFFSDDKILIEARFANNHKITKRFYLPSGKNYFRKNYDRYEIYEDDIRPVGSDQVDEEQ